MIHFREFLTESKKESTGLNDPSTSDDKIAHAVNTKPYHEVLTKAFKHPNAGHHTLHALLNARHHYDDDDDLYFQEVMKHPKIDSSHLHNIGFRARSSETHDKILEHPKADDHSLAGIAHKSWHSHSDTDNVHDRLLNHPKAGQETARAVLINSEHGGNIKKAASIISGHLFDNSKPRVKTKNLTK